MVRSPSVPPPGYVYKLHYLPIDADTEEESDAREMLNPGGIIGEEEFNTLADARAAAKLINAQETNKCYQSIDQGIDPNDVMILMAFVILVKTRSGP